MFPYHWLVSFHLRCWIYCLGGMLWGIRSQGNFPKFGLDTVVHRKVDGPCWKVSKNSRSEPAIHPAESICAQDVFDGVCKCIAQLSMNECTGVGMDDEGDDYAPRIPW